MLLNYANKKTAREIAKSVKPANFSSSFSSDDNLLIKGENLSVLKVLIDKGYKEKIDLVYIDHPFATKNTFRTGENRSETISSSSLDGVVDKERLEQRYLPLKEEMRQVEQNLLSLGKPSNNLKDDEIDKIITGLRQLGEIYKVLDVARRKQFLRFFIKKAFVDSKESKIVNFELVPEFEMLLSRDLVRISSNWLPRVDSNHEPAG